MMRKRINVISGDAGSGKTDLLCQLAMAYAIQGKNVVLYSDEMRASDLEARCHSLGIYQDRKFPEVSGALLFLNGHDNALPDGVEVVLIDFMVVKRPDWLLEMIAGADEVIVAQQLHRQDRIKIDQLLQLNGEY